MCASSKWKLNYLQQKPAELENKKRIFNDSMFQFEEISLESRGRLERSEYDQEEVKQDRRRLSHNFRHDDQSPKSMSWGMSSISRQNSSMNASARDDINQPSENENLEDELRIRTHKKQLMLRLHNGGKGYDSG